MGFPSSEGYCFAQSWGATQHLSPIRRGRALCKQPSVSHRPSLSRAGRGSRHPGPGAAVWESEATLAEGGGPQQEQGPLGGLTQRPRWGLGRQGPPPPASSAAELLVRPMSDIELRQVCMPCETEWCFANIWSV